MKIENIKDYTEKLIASGAEVIQAKKTTPVQARQGIPDEVIETILKNGHREKVGIVRTNEDGNPDWIITNPGGERYPIPDKEFRAGYEVNPENEGTYIKKAIISAVQINEDVVFKNKWDETFDVKKGGYLAVTNMDNIYGIAEDEFRQTYKILEKEPEKELGFFDAEILPRMTASPVFADPDGVTHRFYYTENPVQEFYEDTSKSVFAGIDVNVQKGNETSIEVRMWNKDKKNVWRLSYDAESLENKEKSSLENYAEKSNKLFSYLGIKGDNLMPKKTGSSITGSLTEKIAESEKTVFDIFEKQNKWTVNKEPEIVSIDRKKFRVYKLEGNIPETRGFKTNIIVSEEALLDRKKDFAKEFARGYQAAAEYFEPEWEVNRLAENGKDKEKLYEAGTLLKKDLLENSARLFTEVTDMSRQQEQAKEAKAVLTPEKIGREFIASYNQKKNKNLNPMGEEFYKFYSAANKAKEEVVKHGDGSPEQRQKYLDKYLRSIGINDPTFYPGMSDEIKKGNIRRLEIAAKREIGQKMSIVERLKAQAEARAEKKQDFKRAIERGPITAAQRDFDY